MMTAGAKCRFGAWQYMHTLVSDNFKSHIKNIKQGPTLVSEDIPELNPASWALP